MYSGFTARKLLLTLTLVTVAGLAGCAEYPKRSTGTTLDDQTLEYTVSNAIYRDPSFSTQDHIKVEVNNGVVLLAGETTSGANKDKATRIAEQQTMTKRVVNDLRVGERGEWGARTKSIELSRCLQHGCSCRASSAASPASQNP